MAGRVAFMKVFVHDTRHQQQHDLTTAATHEEATVNLPSIHGYGRTVNGRRSGRASAPHVRHRGDRVFSGWTLGLVSQHAARNIRTIITDDRSALELLNNNTRRLRTAKLRPC